MFVIYFSGFFWYIMLLVTSDAEKPDCSDPYQIIKDSHNKLCNSVQMPKVENYKDAEDRCRTIKGTTLFYARSTKFGNSTEARQMSPDKNILIGLGCNHEIQRSKIERAKFVGCLRTVESLICLQLPKLAETTAETTAEATAETTAEIHQLLEPGFCRQGFSKFVHKNEGVCYSLQKKGLNLKAAKERCKILDGVLLESKSDELMERFAKKILTKYLDVPIWLSIKDECYVISPPDYTEKAKTKCDVEIPSFICESPFITPNECLFTRQGFEYNGTVHKTKEGAECSAWHHASWLRSSNFNGRDMHEQENFCRNPDKHPHIWCYTTTWKKIYSSCNIPLCWDCMYETTLYDGKISITEKNQICDLWTNHRTTLIENNAVEQNILNFCRHFGRDRPWCFTGDGESWEYCNVPLCPDCRFTRKGQEYQGTISMTASGKTCQKWDNFSPNDHLILQDKRYADGSRKRAGNHCRNPEYGDVSPKGPWCYTMNGPRWDYCDIPYCQDVLNL